MDQVVQVLVEPVLFQQGFQGEVHSVLPVVLGVGGYIDSLLLWVRSPKFPVASHQVLQLKYTPHGRRI